jgi:DNA (cytosine-5)-methyltransferase 1
VVNLLPTPCARDWKSGASNLHRRNARPLNEVALLLPTPTASDGTGGPGVSPNRKGGMNLRTLVTTLPESQLIQDWGEFEPAVRRQEALSGREAPIPTELGPRGGRRLTARFAEWLMWIPDGHVTDVPGLSRSEQLQRIGNGVVPIQAHTAYAHLLAVLDAQRGEPGVGSAHPAAPRP